MIDIFSIMLQGGYWSLTVDKVYRGKAIIPPGWNKSRIA